jgi:acetyltransferase-like isoleucine patch superfamily enzyme
MIIISDIKYLLRILCIYLYKQINAIKYHNNIHSFNVSYKSIQGKNITIMSGTLIDKHSCITDYTYVGYNCFITKTSIGRYTSIGNHVHIGVGDHTVENVYLTSALAEENQYDALTKKACTIGHDVWIGANSVVKRGVTIGNGAVIGAGAVVTHDIPAFAVVAGVPATILRYRFKKNIITELTRLAWWNYDIFQAKQLLENFKRRKLQTHK